MKKIEKFDPKFITKTFFKNYSPRDINRGQCFIWAYYAHLIFKDVQILFNDYHAFVKYNGKFYDSQSLNGETDWRLLKTCKKYPSFSRKTTIDHFKHTWGNLWGQTDRFDITWDELEEEAQQAIKAFK